MKHLNLLVGYFSSTVILYSQSFLVYILSLFYYTVFSVLSGCHFITYTVLINSQFPLERKLLPGNNHFFTTVYYCISQFTLVRMQLPGIIHFYLEDDGATIWLLIIAWHYWKSVTKNFLVYRFDHFNKIYLRNTKQYLLSFG